MSVEKEPKQLYINVFQSNKYGNMNTEESHDSIEDCYEGILYPTDGYSYRYTVCVECMQSEGLGLTSRGAEIMYLVDDAREWAADVEKPESFLYGNSAGRRL